jgi:peptide/nickel transport system permease protein
VSAPASDTLALGYRGVGLTGALLLRRLSAEPLGLLGLVLVLVLVFCGLTADWITPYDPLKINIPDRMLEPSLHHLMGTDKLGRDILSRVIKGSQIALLVGVTSIVVAMVIGLALGLIAGYAPRLLDNGLLLCFDTIYSFPSVMLALAVVTLFGSTLTTLIMVVVIIQAPGYARLVRTATLSVRSSEYILAERAMGASRFRILVRHILPNIVGPLLIIASMDIPSVITLEAGLSFLGLGIPPPAPSWGRILQEGYVVLRDAPWVVISGGIPLILTTLGFTFLGESLRDMLDPKLRRAL